MKNIYTLLVIILIAVTAVIIVTVVIIPKLIKKGINVDKYINTANNALVKIDPILKAVNDILPDNPAVRVLNLIDDRAKKAVSAAEQMYISTQLTADQRNAKAKELIVAALNAAGVKITPEIEKIIDGAIETEVLALGHAESSQKILADNLSKQNIQLKAQIDTANANATKAQQNVTELTQKINTIQNTVNQAATQTAAQ